MFTNDYIMRQIEMLVRGIAMITGLKQENRLEECAVLLTDTLRKFFGLNDRSVEALPWQDLTAVASLGGALDAERSVLLAQLIKEKADADGISSGAEQTALYEKALNIYLTAYLADESLQTPQHAGRIDELVSILEGASKPPDTLRLLVAYEEKHLPE